MLQQCHVCTTPVYILHMYSTLFPKSDRRDSIQPIGPFLRKIHYSSFSRKDVPCKEFEPRTDLMRSNATRQCYGSNQRPPLQHLLVHRDLWREPPLVLLLFPPPSPPSIYLITCWSFFFLSFLLSYPPPGYFSALGWRGDTDKYLEHCVICFN